MTRVIAGRFKGQRLHTPPGNATRPTSDRVREALFSALGAWAGTWDDVAVLDLYGGTGAIGLEAASRGARSVLIVEQDRRTAQVIGRNVKDLGAVGVEVRTQAVAAVLAGPAPHPFDLVFADPPYPLADDQVDADLAALAANGWLADEALVVVERSVRSRAPQWPAPLEAWRERSYGDSTLWYGLAESGPSDDEEER